MKKYKTRSFVKKITWPLITVAFSTGILTANTHAANYNNTSNHKETNFDNSKIDPFSEDQGYPQSQLSQEGIYFVNDAYGGKRMKIAWKESEYDGTRRERGHEMKLGVLSNKELFSGFYLNVPKTAFPYDKSTIVWQLYNWNTAGCSNWAAHLEIVNNKLYLNYRSACVEPTSVVVMHSIPRDQDLAFQIRAILSGNNKGKFSVLVDGVTRLDIDDINLGFGEFDSSDRAMTSVVGVKMGMYCADTANYTYNESRTLYYDNVSSVTGMNVSQSYQLIDPRN